MYTIVPTRDGFDLIDRDGKVISSGSLQVEFAPSGPTAQPVKFVSTAQRIDPTPAGEESTT